jgi:hypothetical protein
MPATSSPLPPPPAMPAAAYASRTGPRALSRAADFYALATPYDQSNINDDHGRPGREDYSVLLLAPAALTLTVTAPAWTGPWTPRTAGTATTATSQRAARRTGTTATPTSVRTARRTGTATTPASVRAARRTGTTATATSTWASRITGTATT